MGADLYLDSEFQANRDRWAPKFEQWVKKRDALRKAGKDGATRKAQKRVAKYFGKLYEKGYFRDSYNNTNLLWLFELSWWKDVGRLLDKKGRLGPRNAGKVLQLLESREPAFKANLRKAARSDAEMKQYFIEKYGHLKAFLQAAIRKRESIVCSI